MTTKMMEAGGSLLYCLHDHISVCYQWMDAVLFSVTADKAKMKMVGGTWDFDNGASVSQYVLDRIESLNKGEVKKRRIQ